MEAVFSLQRVADRATYIHSLMQSFSCTYICVWLYHRPPQHRLYYLGGHFKQENKQAAGPSSGSLAKRLFDGYCQEVFLVQKDHVPGMAFSNNLPYEELNQSQLLQLTSAAVQRQFYQEANIQTAVFMGCRSGEIEMGWSNANHINMENTMMNWFSEYNTHQQPQLSQSLDPNLPSSSSSSLRSLDSPESSPFMFNIPTTTHIQEIRPEVHSLQPMATTPAIQQILQSFQPIQSSTTSPLHQALQSLQQAPSTTSPLQEAMQALQQTPSTTASSHQRAMQQPSTMNSYQQAMQAFALTRNVQIPSKEIEEAAMRRAILAVLSSPSSSSTSNSNPNLPYSHHHSSSPQRASAFNSYLAPRTPMRTNLRRISMLKRALTYYRSLNAVRRENMIANRPSSTQLHHMISERKRREKINESFEALRKLLPPESKKDKASVLTRTREYVNLLKNQVAELSQRNQQLEAQLLPTAKGIQAEEATDQENERVNVRITNVSESTSEEERTVNLQVVLRGECLVSNMVIQILEFLKQVNNVSVMSIEANSTREESRSLSRVILRLRIEGNEWDEAAFQEAIKRVIADLVQ